MDSSANRSAKRKRVGGGGDLDFDALRGAFQGSNNNGDTAKPPPQTASFLPENLEEMGGDDMVFQSLSMDSWEPAKSSFDEGFTFEMLPVGEWELPTFNSSVFDQNNPLGSSSSPIPIPGSPANNNMVMSPQQGFATQQSNFNATFAQNANNSLFSQPPRVTQQSQMGPGNVFSQQQATQFTITPQIPQRTNSTPRSTSAELLSPQATPMQVQTPGAPAPFNTPARKTPNSALSALLNGNTQNLTPLPNFIPSATAVSVFGQSSSDEIAELKQKNSQLESMLTMVYNMFLQQDEKIKSLQSQIERLQASQPPPQQSQQKQSGDFSVFSQFGKR